MEEQRSGEQGMNHSICGPLSEVESQFFNAFAEAPIGMLLTTPAGLILEANYAFAGMLGFGREELLHRNCASFAHPEDFEATSNFFHQLSAGLANKSKTEKRFLQKSGKTLWVRVTASMGTSQNGPATKLVLVIEDITDQKRSEAALEESESRFQIMANSAPVLIWISDTTKACVWFNRVWLDFTGRSMDQEYGYGWAEGVHPDDYESCVGIYVKAFDSRESFRMDYRLRRHDGEWRWLLDHGVPRYEADGTFTGYIGSCVDITERRQAEEALRENEARLRLSQSAGRVGSFDWRLDTGVVLWSPVLEDLYGVAEGSFSGTLEDWAARIDPQDYPRVAAGIRQCIAKGQQQFSCELRAVLPDGQRRWLQAQGVLSFNDSGSAVRMLGVNIDIDNQKLAEARLQQQWKNFDIALSHSPDAAYVFDLNGRFTYANRSLLSLWGKSLDEIVNKNFYDLSYPPDLADRVTSQVQTVINTGEQLRGQTKYAGQSGESRFYDYIFSPVFLSDGQIEAVVGTSRDITEAKKVEAVVEEDRRQWRELLFQTPAAIAILKGPAHHFEWANDDYSILTSRPLDEVIGKSVLEALPEVEKQDFIAILDKVYQTGEPFEGHGALVQLNNLQGLATDYYIDFAFLPTRDSFGQINGIFVHATDVTEGVRARKQLEENEQQFRTLAETIPHLAWMADQSGYIFWYNRRWYEYTGTTLEQMQGWGWQSVHDPKMVDEVTSVWRQSIQSGVAFEKTFPLKGSDGLFRTFLTRVEPVRDTSGKVVRWFGTNTDITDQQRIEAELRRSNRELEEFAYVASHDLQEPLRMVNIYTDQILRHLKSDDATLNQYAEFVRTGVDRMQALIQDLLSFSIAVHTERQTTETANLATSLLDALSLLNSRIEETGASINRPSLPLVAGDSAQFAQVFQNLISNAIKYRGERPLIIEIDSRREGDFWIVSVRDNGIGFEQQYAERIFGLFKRLHSADYPGTGLGLAICKRIVERYGGQTWAEGTLGKGAAFHFSVPAVN